MQHRGPYQKQETSPDDKQSPGLQPPSPEIREKLAAQIAQIKKRSEADRETRLERREKAKENSPPHKPAVAPLSAAEEIARIEAGMPFTPSISPRDQTIAWLLSQGLAPLPVAPAFPANEYPLRRKGKIVFDSKGNPQPKFNGKNPSHLNKEGKPQILNHKQYQHRLPTTKELQTWFENPATGVGTLGTDQIQFIDLDRKNFNTQEKIDRTAREIFEKLGGEGLLEQTRSGGWRIAIASNSQGCQIATDETGKHRGELLGPGLFAVLAPSSGYTTHARTAKIPKVKALQDLNIVPAAKFKPAAPIEEPAAPVEEPAAPVEEPAAKQRQRKYQKPKTGIDPYERFPADCWQHYGAPLTLWVIARHFDPEGKGWALLDMAKVEEIAGRKESTIRLWLKKGRKSGLFRFTATKRTQNVENTQIKIYYASMTKIAVAAGLEKLGAVRLVNFDKDIKNLRILATDAIAADLQKASRFAAELKERQIAEKNQRKPIRTLKPEEICQPCAKRLSRVLWCSFWAVFVSEGFVAYGSCQNSISNRRNLSTRQVRRHLTNSYRREPSPIRGYRGIGDIKKTQICQRLKSRVKSEFVNSGFSKFPDKGAVKNKFFIDSENRTWEKKCNCYFFPENQLVNLRMIKKKYPPPPGGM